MTKADIRRQHAAIDAALFKGHFGKPQRVVMTRDRALSHLAAIRLEAARKISRAARRSLRPGLSALRVAAKELGTAGVLDTVAALQRITNTTYTTTEVV